MKGVFHNQRGSSQERVSGVGFTRTSIRFPPSSFLQSDSVGLEDNTLSAGRIRESSRGDKRLSARSTSSQAEYHTRPRSLPQTRIKRTEPSRFFPQTRSCLHIISIFTPCQHVAGFIERDDHRRLPTPDHDFRSQLTRCRALFSWHLLVARDTSMTET